MLDFDELSLTSRMSYLVKVHSKSLLSDGGERSLANSGAKLPTQHRQESDHQSLYKRVILVQVDNGFCRLVIYSAACSKEVCERDGARTRVGRIWQSLFIRRRLFPT